MNDSGRIAALSKGPVRYVDFEAGGGPAVVVHGGAWAIPDSEVEAHKQALRSALAAGARSASGGAGADEVIVEVLTLMEDSGVFDAGRGSVLRSDGTAVMDAGIMRGRDMAFGAVGAVRRLRNPIRGAFQLMDRGMGQVRLVAGIEAEALLKDFGCALVDPDFHVCQRETQRFSELNEQAEYHTSQVFRRPTAPLGTIGCVVRDSHGNVAAGTSTGGTPLSASCRIGDTPLPGCGFYSLPVAAASATGWGEALATVLACGRSVAAVEAGLSPGTAISDTLQYMHEIVRGPDGRGAAGGLILIRNDGAFSWAFTSPRMARAWWTSSLGTNVAV